MSLALRAAFITILAICIIAIGRLVFEIEQSAIVVIIALMFYLGVQYLDWLRGILSGLNSLVCLVAAASLILFFKHGSFYWLSRDIEHILTPGAVVMSAVYLNSILAGGFIYLTSLFIVDATRKGKVYGIPEIWQWRLPERSTVGKVLRPFSSPIAAQVWLDLRRSKFVLPIVTVALTPTLYLGAMMDGSMHMYWGVAAPFIAMSVAVFAQGLVLNVLGWRHTKGLPGYTWLVPLTDAHFAYARVITHAILILPTLLFVLVMQHVVPSTYFLTFYLPEALDAGIITIQETAWMLTARTYLGGILLWALMAVSTRTVGKSLGLGIAVSIVMVALNISRLMRDHYLYLIVPVGLLLLCVVAFARAYRQGIIGKRSLLFWSVVWLLVSFPFLAKSIAEVPHYNGGAMYYLVTSISALAIGSLLPLPFVAIAFDIRKRRHSATPKQQFPSGQHIRDAGLPVSRRWLSVAAVASIFIVWMGLPLPWAYKDVWRAKGYPGSLEELNAWYEAVPDDQNRALRYLEVTDEVRALGLAYDHEAAEDLSDHGGHYVYLDTLFIHGTAEYHPNNGIDPNARQGTLQYWDAVTRTVAPTLVEIGNDDSTGSRYPVDLRDSFNTQLEHLSGLRNLAQHSSLDTMVWSMQDDPGKATDSALAPFAIADSLSKEPILISGLVRIAIYGIGLQAINTSINITQYDDANLARLQNELKRHLEVFEDEPILRRAFIGETAMSLDALAHWATLAAINGAGATDSGLDYAAYIPHSLAAMPRGGDIVVSGYHSQRMIDSTEATWNELVEMEDLNDWENIGSMAIMSMIMMPALIRAEEASWRVYTTFDITITGVALERYRLANGNYPDSLDDLVPDYLDEVPMDKMSRVGAPLRYKAIDDGGVVVYSVSRDGEDDGGKTMNNRWLDGDLGFEIYPRKSDELEYIPPPPEP